MKRISGYVFVTILLLIIHTTLIRFLAIGGIAPDILLVLVAYIAVREGQIRATVAGFLIGILVDLISGSGGMLGLSALSMTLAGFVAGYFYNENKVLQNLGSYRFLIIIGAAALLHHTVYFLIFLQGSSLGVDAMILRYGIAAAVYTTALGLLPMFVYARRMGM